MNEIMNEAINEAIQDERFDAHPLFRAMNAAIDFDDIPWLCNLGGLPLSKGKRVAKRARDIYCNLAS